MNCHEDVEYRLNLAQGFLQEAEEDHQLSRWRSCVANSQLSVENAGKAILMLFGVAPKTHDPAKHLATLIHNDQIPHAITDRIKEGLSDFQTLGVEEHFMTDYGDEPSHRLPWDIFDEDSASSALNSARSCLSIAQQIVEGVKRWRKEL
jgi:HEPN domain-containing protein